MTETWIPLQSIPQSGKLLCFDDQAIWETPLAEFHIPCRIVESVKAEITVFPQEEGVLFRGKISGTVALPCARCSEYANMVINHSFDSFEPFPTEQSWEKNADDDLDTEEVDEAVIRLAEHGRGVEINPAALAWEEFSLSLPVSHLCQTNCKGLCPKCGANLNQESCSCEIFEGDPRMAPLRGLAIKVKK